MTQFLGDSPARASSAADSTAAATPQHALLRVVNGTYTSPPRRVGWVARWIPSLAFYPRFLSVVFRGAAAAKRGQYDGRDWSLSSLGVLRALEAVGCQFEITGIDHIERLTGPAVFAGNHMSTLETAVLPVIIQPIREVTFVVKQSLIDYPVFKHIMRSRDPIAVTQTNPRADLKTTLSEGADRLGRGSSVVVFPEGRRRIEFEQDRFNSIAVKLAHRGGVPLVPFALQTDAWELGRRVSDIGRIDPDRKVRFAFGAPLMVDGRGTEQQQAVIDFIAGKLAEWRTEDDR
jgi:1-acyl-sn-glycerol-3-phosphate acyltransferase